MKLSKNKQTTRTFCAYVMIWKEERARHANGEMSERLSIIKSREDHLYANNIQLYGVFFISSKNSMQFTVTWSSFYLIEVRSSEDGCEIFRKISFSAHDITT